MDTFNSDEDLVQINTNSARVLSHLFEVSLGGFGKVSSNQEVRSYFSSSNVSVLLDELKTYESLAVVNDWPVSQTIQREIDEDRTKDIARKYLLSVDPLKYYPPITVVLLPEENGKIVKEYKAISDTEDLRISIYNKFKTQFNISVNPTSDDVLKKKFKEAQNLSEVDGIYILRINYGFEKTIMCWDPTRFEAVVIDGQHRFESLKRAKEFSSDVGAFKQDVVFIDIAHKYKLTNQNPVDISKKIFVDVNKNAKSMNLSTVIIMDDRDMAALFVQALLDDSGKQSNFLKPQLIDWHSLNLKHQLPHLTSVLTLYQIFSDFIFENSNLITVEDLRNNQKVSNFVKILNSKFLVDNTIETNSEYVGVSTLASCHNEFKQSIDEDPQNPFVFNFDYNVFKVASKNFRTIYQDSFVKLFQELKPYKDVITFMSTKGAFDPSNNLRRALIVSDKKRELAPNQQTAYDNLRREINGQNVATDFALLFTVLGQKTLFSIYWEDLIKSVANNITHKSVNEATDKFIAKMNFLFSILKCKNEGCLLSTLEKKPLKSYSPLRDMPNYYDKFLEGIIYQNGAIIYNSRGIQSFKALIKYLMEFAELNKDVTKKTNLQFPQAFNIPWLESRIEKSFSEFKEKDITASYKKTVLDVKKQTLEEYLKSCF